jgi:hypothetical protein
VAIRLRPVDGEADALTAPQHAIETAVYDAVREAVSRRGTSASVCSI